jgi:hypothetical protein
LDETIGIPIEIKSNEFNEIAGNTYHKIVFQIKEEEFISHESEECGVILVRIQL